MARCWYCGDASPIFCYGCGANLCEADARYYFDPNNRAISASAKPKCPTCDPDKFPRPFTLARAIERGEWEPRRMADVEPEGKQLQAARAALAEATRAARTAAIAAMACGRMSESEAARQYGVTRMTIRAWKANQD